MEEGSGEGWIRCLSLVMQLLPSGLTNQAEIFRVGSVPARLAEISALPMGIRAKSVDHKCICKSVEGKQLQK